MAIISNTKPNCVGTGFRINHAFMVKKYNFYFLKIKFYSVHLPMDKIKFKHAKILNTINNDLVNNFTSSTSVTLVKNVNFYTMKSLFQIKR